MGKSKGGSRDNKKKQQEEAKSEVEIRHLGDGMIEIDPSVIFFTHARIRPFFTGCGRRVEDTLMDLRNGSLVVDALPKITVICNDGNYYSLNNRRLYVLKELRSAGTLMVIKARLKVALDREKDRYTVERMSLTARIMKERIKDTAGGGVDGDDDAGGADDDDDIDGDHNVKMGECSDG